MTTISIDVLTLVNGGQSERQKNVCNRQQFDWMAAHMVPDTSMQPGVPRHVVAGDAKTCGFPMPTK
jgi:hypothetical protein